MGLKRCLYSPIASQPMVSVFSLPLFGGWEGSRAILDENVQAFLDGERGVEDDESETERENVVTGANLQEVANGTLRG